MRVPISLSLACLTMVSLSALGQDVTERESQASSTSRNTAETRSSDQGSVLTVPRNNASRLESATPELKTIILENEITTTTTLPEVTLHSCQAGVALSYYQSNTLARVKIEVSHHECPVSEGSVDIVVSYRNAADELNTLNVSEPWQRSNADKLEFTRDYDIGEQVVLSSVRSRNVRCTCSDASE